MLKFLLTLLLILITSCHTLINENVSKDVESRMQKFMVDKKISGAVTLAYHKGNIIHHQATGFANISTKEKMTTESLFRIASLTKNVTAISVMMLQDRGKLSVNDKVSKYIPEYANLIVKDSNHLADLRIRHLMSHTSGIILPRNDNGSMTLKQVAVAGTSKPLIFTPGSQWRYSRGLDVCAYIVEKVSGSPFSDFLNKEIFLPLQMKNTGFYLNEEQVKRLVITYQPSKDGKHIIPSTLERLVKPPVGMFTPGPSGGLISSAQDMGRFYQMLLNGGELDGKRIISETSAKIIRQSQTGENKAGFVPGSAWGLGFGLVQQPEGVSAMLNEGSFGHGGAFGTQGWVDPITETVYVLMIQRIKFGNSDASDIRRGFQQAVADGIK